MTEGTTGVTQEIAEQQAEYNAHLQLIGSGTTITPWTHVVLMQSVNSIHGKTQRPVS